MFGSNNKLDPSWLASIDFFEGLDDDELRRISALGERLDLDAGAELIDQGRVGDACYVIVDGRAAVRIGGEFVTTVGPGNDGRRDGAGGPPSTQRERRGRDTDGAGGVRHEGVPQAARQGARRRDRGCSTCSSGAWPRTRHATPRADRRRRRRSPRRSSGRV